jgi:poly(3-hydroxybutyrate) depolymerase
VGAITMLNLGWTVILMAMLVTVAGDGAITRADDRATPTTGLVSLRSRLYPDQAYFLYVPPSYDGSRELRLLVSMHGAHRRAMAYAERFIRFADEHGYVVLAPVFPDDEAYQTLGVKSVYRADLRLLGLVDEVAEQYRVETTQFDLFGFSGGGQFAHRFMYLHPERLRSVAIGAPGTVTVPSDQYRWPDGTADLEQVVGVSLDLSAIQARRIMLLVGDQDVGSDELNESRAADRLGYTRLERARTLHAAWEAAGIPHAYLEVAGVGHQLDHRILDPVRRFIVGQ